MNTSKPRVVKDYDKLSPEIQEQIKLIYPYGFVKHLVAFHNREGERKMGLPFETDEVYYLVRMSTVKAQTIVNEDDDFDDEGFLKESVKAEYDDKHGDVEYLAINANEDNDLTAIEDMIEELDD